MNGLFRQQRSIEFSRHYEPMFLRHRLPVRQVTLVFCHRNVAVTVLDVALAHNYTDRDVRTYVTELPSPLVVCAAEPMDDGVTMAPLDRTCLATGRFRRSRFTGGIEAQRRSLESEQSSQGPLGVNVAVSPVSGSVAGTKSVRLDGTVAAVHVAFAIPLTRQRIFVSQRASAAEPLVMAVAKTARFGDVVTVVNRTALQAKLDEPIRRSVTLHSCVVPQAVPARVHDCITAFDSAGYRWFLGHAYWLVRADIACSAEPCVVRLAETPRNHSACTPFDLAEHLFAIVVRGSDSGRCIVAPSCGG